MDKFLNYRGSKSLTNHPILPQSRQDTNGFDDLLTAAAWDKELGLAVSRFELCVNAYGQNVASSEAMQAYPEQIKFLEDVFANEKPVSKAQHSGAVINGIPAIVLSYSFTEESLKYPDGADRILLHAQTRMMAEQLKEALLAYNANISASFCSPVYGSEEVVDEIHAVFPAEAEPERRRNFERAFDTVLNNLPLSRDYTWVKNQYDFLRSKLGLPGEENFRPNLVIREGCPADDVLIEACGSLGHHLGFRQFAFDKAHSAHNDALFEKLAAECDVTRDNDLLFKCLYNGGITADCNGKLKVTLFTKSFEKRHKSISDGFYISKKDLRSIMNKIGYEKDFSMSAFMNSYSYETAKEIKALYDELRKKPLSQILGEAERKHNSVSPGTNRNREEGHEL